MCLQALRRAMADCSGAVTIDWVVLMAGLVALVFSIGTGMSLEVNEITAALFDHANAGVAALQ